MSNSNSFRSVFGRGTRLPAASPFVLHVSAPFGAVTPHTAHGPAPPPWLAPLLGLPRRVKARAVAGSVVSLALLLLLLDALNLGPAFLSSRHAPSPRRPSPAPPYLPTAATGLRADAGAALQLGASAGPGAGTAGQEQSGEGAPAREGAADQSCGHSSPPCEYQGAAWLPHVHRWLTTCWSPHVAAPPSLIQERLYNKACPNNCSGNGVCNREIGQCLCRMGYQGAACTEAEDYECNRAPTAELPHGLWLPTICPAHCDKHTSRCYCGPGTNFPRRPLFHPCGFATMPQGGADLRRVDNFSLFDPEVGYCNWDPQSGTRGAQSHWQGCGHECMDGRSGFLCAVYHEAYCVSQCSGHGTCSSGYCECRDGFYGMDCSTPSADSPRGEPSSLFLRGAPSGGQGKEETPPVVPVLPKGDVLPVLRRRPLVYVYDLSRRFTTDHLESRIFNWYCVPRLYSEANVSFYNEEWLYSMEAAVIESLLASPHRTLNAAEADYFLVPLLGGCIQVRADENPSMNMQEKFLGSRSWMAASFYERAREYIDREYPFWRRHGGKDHIWIFPWDEGACAAPRSIWPGIMLSHWGNTMSRHNYSTTAYLADSWRMMPEDVRGAHPCFDPTKDVVLPAFKAPKEGHLRQRLWERPLEERPRLFYFNGNLGRNYGGRPEMEYSMGIRQKVASYYAAARDKTGIGPTQPHDSVLVTSQRANDYSAELAGSQFCGVFPGDGFSARMEDSILHGCIPVVIQDGIQMAFENALDHSRFALRVAEADIPRMVRIIQEIPRARVREMQQAVSRVASRWFYRSFLLNEAQRQAHRGKQEAAWVPHLRAWKGEDAIDTLIEVNALPITKQSQETCCL